MRFDIGQISNPVALEAATAHLRDQLGANGVPTALIDLLISWIDDGDQPSHH